jgi:hypothetical protein
MDNEFEAAVWVADRPRILNLALEIKKAKTMPVNSANESSQILDIPSYSISTTLTEIDQVI